MALMIVEGAVAQRGEASAVSSKDTVTDVVQLTGAAYTFVRFAKASARDVELQAVVADLTLDPYLAVMQSGRYAFYRHGETLVLCGYFDGTSLSVLDPVKDPAAIEAGVQRTLAKRKIFWGVVMIPTFILITFGIDKIKEGRQRLKDNPTPKRPTEEKIRRALERGKAGFWK